MPGGSFSGGLEQVRTVRTVRSWSPFFASLTDKQPDLFDASLDAEDLDNSSLEARYRTFVSSSDQDLPGTLRALREREMARIIYRDLTRLADLQTTTRELSCLADFCIRSALDHAFDACTTRFGTPRDKAGNPQQLVVLAMGKLGAHELNLSSDIDLILFYGEPGKTDGERMLTSQEFFIRVARQLIATLDASSDINLVFRVDMRLRPYGDSGPLVLQRAAMEKYYLEQGRDWERYAFIKARFVAGDDNEGLDFLNWIQPFVFRRHLDFGAIQSLREMKGLITRQVELRESSHDVKLGPGGIREIEFIAQAHQLIWGGRYPALREPRLLSVLKTLAEMSLIDDSDLEILTEAYTFLRNTEHVIQAEHDRQTHLLPEDPSSRARLAAAMGFPDWDSFLARLDHHRAQVRTCFSSLIAAPDQSVDIEPAWMAAWEDVKDGELRMFRDSVEELALETSVRETLNALVPALLQTAHDTAEPELAISRMLPVLQSILRRSTYMVFLLENADALRHAVQLVIISPWIAEQLKAYPILLYDLTDRSLQAVAVSRRELEADLRELLRTVESDDVESRMDVLRQFKLSAMCKIAAMELTDRLSIMEASDGLTALAEVILTHAIEMAERYLVSRHGEPCDSEGQPLEETFAIVAYGKAGGLELAYGSDLDLVFLVPDNLSGQTNGNRQVSNSTFFLRLGQRIVHVLTSFTRFGVLYSVDLRLRPQGNKGPLVATLNAFNRYLEHDAWTWEHQALVRARFVAGGAGLGEHFADIRNKVLSQYRDRADLLGDVLDMREKMRIHLDKGTQGASQGDIEESGMEVLAEFDLKHDPGAIVVIEFMVQYAVLGWAETHPSLTRWTDVMRILDELAQADVLDEADAESLQKAYLAFRAAIHHGWLGLDTDYPRLQHYRQTVRQIWVARMSGDTGSSGAREHE